MTEYIPHAIGLILLGLGVGWYAYRWGHSDGREEGYADGHDDGKAGRVFQPQGGGGPGDPEK